MDASDPYAQSLIRPAHVKGGRKPSKTQGEGRGGRTPIPAGPSGVRMERDQPS